MNPPDAPSQEPGSPASEPAPDAQTLGAALADLWAATWVRFQGRIELISLDVRRAALSLAHIIVLSLLCAFLLWAAWVSVMAGLVCMIEHFTGSYGWGFLAVMVLNLLLAAWLWRRVASLAHNVTLPETRALVVGGPR